MRLQSFFLSPIGFSMGERAGVQALTLRFRNARRCPLTQPSRPSRLGTEGFKKLDMTPRVDVTPN
jgi:hypothetical protein